MNEVDIRRHLQIAAEALREAFLLPPHETHDQGLEDKLLDLFRYLQHCDLRLQIDQAPPAEKTLTIGKILTDTAFQMVLQLLKTTPCQNRYDPLRAILCNAMEALGVLAYTEEGNARFLLDLSNVMPCLPLLKSHVRIEGHAASAIGVRLYMNGFVKPFFKNDPAVKIFSDGLHALASSKGPLTLDEIIRDCTDLLCTFWKTRFGFHQGVPYGCASGARWVGTNDWPSTVEEITRVPRARKGGLIPHYARVYIFKLALADAQLLVEMHDSGSDEFEAARNAIKVHVHVNALLACITYLKYAVVQNIETLAEKAITTLDYSASLPGVQSPSNRDPPTKSPPTVPRREPDLPLSEGQRELRSNKRRKKLFQS